MRTIIIILFTLSLSACATSSGFNRDSLRNSLGNEKKVITNGEIKKALEAKAQLPKPFKLAIYTRMHDWRVNWNEEDKKELHGLTESLINKGVVSEVVYLNSSVMEGNDNFAIRLAAARTGSDAVLIIHGDGSIDRYNNYFGSTYFLIVTPFFVPGTVSDGLFIVSASIWDVRNQYIYLTAEAEGMASKTGPGFLLEDKHVMDEAKSKSVKLLRNEIESRLTSMK